MGLDMYMEKRRILSRTESKRVVEESDVMYWRKANMIHDWFNNLIGDIQNCHHYEIELADLDKLLVICKEIYTKQNEDVSKELLPTAGGFFFGSLEYDEYYYSDIKETIDGIEKIKAEHQDGDIYEYYAWW